MIRFQQYRRRKSYLLAIILLAIFVSYSSLNDLFGLRWAAGAVIYPFQFALAAIWKGTVAVPAAVLNLRNLSTENTRLKNELAGLRPRVAVLEELKQENLNLRQALGFERHNRFGFGLTTANVIAKVSNPWFSIIEIDRGSRAGVRPGLAVVTPDGLAGQIVEVSLFSSKVMLLTDPKSNVAAQDISSRDFGVVSGNLTHKLFMKYVGAGSNIIVGDQIVTSAISTIFPPGIPIGRVTKAEKREQDLFYHLEIEPAAKFSTIEQVFVIF